MTSEAANKSGTFYYASGKTKGRAQKKSNDSYRQPGMGKLDALLPLGISRRFQNQPSPFKVTISTRNVFCVCKLL